MARRRALALAAVVLVGIPVVLYVFLFTLQAYSVWQASRTLDRLEALRVGDPAQDCDRAISTAPIQFGAHTLTAGAYRFTGLWNFLWKVSPRLAYELQDFTSQVGLRYWRLNASCGVHDGRISSLSTGLMVMGRYEMLGGGWRFASSIPDSYFGRQPDKNLATGIRFFAIDSPPNGEGVEIFATTRSSQADVAARRINQECLLSFRGCESLCQLLPHAAPIFEERHLTSFACMTSHWQYEKQALVPSLRDSNR